MQGHEHPSRTAPIRGWLIAILLGLIAAIAATIGLMAFAQSRTNPGWGMMGYWGGSWGWMAGMAALMMALPLVILVAVLLVAGASVRSTVPEAHLGLQDPSTILRARFARGEITREQFDQMSRDLGLRS